MTKILIVLSAGLLLTACGASAVTSVPAQLTAEPTGPQEPAQITLGPTDISAPMGASSTVTACPICGMDIGQYSGPLGQQEVEGLLQALNDEYYAWAVYDQVIEDFGQVRPFVNIQGAEANHIDALLSLFRTYQVPIPENPWPGDVGSFDSVQEACAAGVQAEIENAALYDELFKTTGREDILKVYQSLQRASQEQHLPAFQRCAGR